MPCLIVRIVRRVTKKAKSRIDPWLEWTMAFAFLGMLISAFGAPYISVGLAAKNTKRDARMKDWYHAIFLYVTDNDDRFPLIHNWAEATAEYFPSSAEATLRDPVTELERGIGMNGALSGKGTSDVNADVVILVSGKNASSIEKRMPIKNDPMGTALFLSGRRVTLFAADEILEATPDGEVSLHDTGDN